MSILGFKEMEYHRFFPTQIKLKVMMSYLVFFQINKKENFQSYRSSSWQQMKKTPLIPRGWKTVTPKSDKDSMRKESDHPISYRNIDVMDFAKKSNTHQIQKYLNIQIHPEQNWCISVNVGFINIKDQQM